MKKPKALWLRSETREGCPLLPLLFNNAVETLANAVRKKGTDRCTNWEEKKQTVFILRWHDSLGRKSQKVNNNKTPGTNKTLRYSVNIQKSVAVLYTKIKNWNLK